MRKWIQNKWIERNLEQEVRNQHNTEVSQLNKQIEDLSMELAPLENPPYKEIVTMVFKDSLCVASTLDKTFTMKFENDSELKKAVQYMIPNDLRNLDASIKNRRVTFCLNLHSPLFAKFLPTLSFMHLKDDSTVQIELDFKKQINLEDVRNFANVVVGITPFTQDEETYQQVFKSALYQLSSSYGVILESESLDKITLDTALFTQIVIKPKNTEIKCKLLRVTLGDFYNGSFREKIQSYISVINEEIRNEKNIDYLKNTILNYLESNGLLKDLYFNINPTANGTLNCELVTKERNLPSVIRISFSFSYKMPPSKSEITYFVDSAIKKEINNVMLGLYHKHKEYVPVPYTKSLLFSKSSFVYEAGIDGNVITDVSKMKNVFSLYELELLLLKYYSLDSVKRLKFTNEEDYDVFKGEIGDISKVNIMEVTSEFLKPYQLYQAARFMTELPDEKENIYYDWCEFSFEFNRERLLVKLDNYKPQSINFVLGYRYPMLEIEKIK